MATMIAPPPEMELDSGSQPPQTRPPMLADPPHSVEILGNRFRVATRHGTSAQDRDLDVFADLLEHFHGGSVINNRQELARDDALRMRVRFRFQCIDEWLFKRWGTYHSVEQACQWLMDLICFGRIPCHELRDGVKEYIDFRDENGEIDHRIQQLRDTWTFIMQSNATEKARVAAEKARKRKATREASGKPSKKSAKKTKEKTQTRDEIPQEVQDRIRDLPDTPERPQNSPCPVSRPSHRADEDDKEPVKPEAPAREPEQSNNLETLTKDETYIKTEATAPPLKIITHELIEIDSDSDTDEPPRGQKSSVEESKTATDSQQATKDERQLPKAFETEVATPQLVAASVDSTILEAATTAISSGNSGNPIKIEADVESDQRVAPFNAPESITPAPSTDGNSRQTTAAPRSINSSGDLGEATNNLKRKHETETTTAKEQSDDPPIDPSVTASVIRDRIAIKQLKLEILQMRYEMEHGKEYSG